MDVRFHRLIAFHLLTDVLAFVYPSLSDIYIHLNRLSFLFMRFTGFIIKKMNFSLVLTNNLFSSEK